MLEVAYYNQRLIKSKEPCIRVNTRKLNKVPKYNIFYLYMLGC